MVREVLFMIGGRPCVAVQVGEGRENLDAFEVLSSRESVDLLQELANSDHRSAVADVLERFGIRDFDTLISDFSEGMSRLQILQQPRTFGTFEVLSPAPEDDLVELAGDNPDEEEHWVEVELRNPAGEPVPGFELEIELTNGSLRSRRTNLFGLTRVDGMRSAGTCKVRLPILDASDVPEPPPAEVGSVEFELLDEDGPCAQVELEVELADGSTRTVTTDAAGRVLLEGVDPGLCTVTQRPPAS